MKAFIEGLFGPGAYNAISQPARPENDSFLVPVKNCPSWSAVLNNLKAPDSAPSKFLASPLVAQMLDDVGKRLG